MPQVTVVYSCLFWVTDTLVIPWVPLLPETRIVSVEGDMEGKAGDWKVEKEPTVEFQPGALHLDSNNPEQNNPQ